MDVFTRYDRSLLPLISRFDGVRVINVPAGPPIQLPKEQLLPFMEEFARFTIEFFRREETPYNVVHANFFMSGLVGLRVKAALRTPLVTTFHALGRVRRLHSARPDGACAASRTEGGHHGARSRSVSPGSPYHAPPTTLTNPWAAPRKPLPVSETKQMQLDRREKRTRKASENELPSTPGKEPRTAGLHAAVIQWQALIAAALIGVIVCYAHYEIPSFTLGAGKRRTAHLVLIVVGLAFGAMGAYTLDLPMPAWLVLLLGFGAVHVPAAAILALKRLRGSGMS